MSKICLNCGNQIEDSGIQFCPSCGKPLGQQGYKSGLLTASKIFMIVSCISIGWTLIPLLWLIPMTCKISNREITNQQLGIGFKICTLLFGNIISGILLLCDNDA